jgi:beta-galactosidase GanA
MLNKNIFNHFILALCASLIPCTAALSEDPNFGEGLSLRRQADFVQLIVDGNPFLVLGGELHNSSASSLDYMEPIWPKLVQMNLNTVLAPIYWDLIEPREDSFDFSLADGLIEGARQHELKLVLLWFGSWKNSMSCYAPGWVKTDEQRFARARLADGKALEILSPFSEENLHADARAFKALMKHIAGVDSIEHTVIMIQVENEIGMLTDARDHSDAANEAFDKPVPEELINYLTKHKETLVSELREIWAAGGNKTSGNWQDVFGKGAGTDEIFMAWYFGRYVNYLAEQGKAEYSLPMYVNAALNRANYKPGQYPSAGPLPHLMDVWRAAAPQIDFLSPDIYFQNFAYWCGKYRVSGNPLFIPEARNDSDCGAKAFYVFGQYDAMGFSPFGIEDAAEPNNAPIGKSYAVLSQLAPLILRNQGKGKMAGVLLDKENQTTEIKLGNYIVKFSHDYTWSWSSGPKEADVWPQAGGIIISTGPDQYVIAGSGIIVTFTLEKQQSSTGIVSIQEGHFEQNRWIGGRWLNGDEDHQGRHVRLPFGGFGIQKVWLYTYQ